LGKIGRSVGQYHQSKANVCYTKEDDGHYIPAKIFAFYTSILQFLFISLQPLHNNPQRIAYGIGRIDEEDSNSCTEKSRSGSIQALTIRHP
jgi:hypothetical protein